MSKAFIPIFLSNALLSALSISNLGMISSMVGFIHSQKHDVDTYQVNWPRNTVYLKALPEHIWMDQGHTSNGVAGYGFFLGLFGMVVAWRLRRRDGKISSKSLTLLAVLQTLATLFTLSALIFTFTVTRQTSHQHILPQLAVSNIPYSMHKWTPETWFKAVLELPLAEGERWEKIRRNVRVMEAWRWMLIPIFLLDLVALGCSAWAVSWWRRERREQSEFTIEK
ncbi:hypothetical protein GQ43DRAFT_425764 [Delitschia confertaspora ATCC 74209]|uniref:Uncharacterized protein n=1 Tax=Delitschia confertaspora ATCC 74209 TaxID=1513339 RepID=A0A9P4MNC9_9PLEO|nr:hypothetical protein GQ43DRAFT_425764 [Delitschia confertaspora ATCC 74209]